jgi:hypothetical protein
MTLSGNKTFELLGEKNKLDYSNSEEEVWIPVKMKE